VRKNVPDRKASTTRPRAPIVTSERVLSVSLSNSPRIPMTYTSMTRKKTVNKAHKIKENLEILLSALCMKIYFTFFSSAEPVTARLG
jgi:hypothetical protein